MNNVTTKVLTQAQPKGTKPFTYLYFDLLEGLPKSGGYRHCLIYVDSFSKMCGCVPLKSKDSQVILQQMCSIIQTMGPAVKEIVCDNATVFRNRALYEICGLLGVKVRWSVVRRSQARGQVERYVQTIATTLRKVLVTRPSIKWHLLVHFVVFQINNRYNDQIRGTPYLISKGIDETIRNAENTPDSIIYSHLTTELMKDNVTRLKGEANSVWQKVKVNLEKLDAEQMRKRHNTRSRLPRVKVGDVCVRKLYRTVVNIRLRERFSPDLYVVVSVSETAAIIIRVIDNLTSKVSLTDIKVLQFPDEAIKENLPPEAVKLLFGNPVSRDKLRSLINILIEKSKFDLPPVDLEEPEPLSKTFDTLSKADQPETKKGPAQSETSPTETEDDDDEIESDSPLIPAPEIKLKGILKDRTSSNKDNAKRQVRFEL